MEILSSCQMSDCSGDVGILGVFLCTTQDEWCHCWIDRQRRESQSSWTSRRCPHLPRSFVLPLQIHTHTHPPVYSTLFVVQTAPQPHFRPLFSSLPDRPSPRDKQRNLITPFPIINPCCVHTMGPKESCRQERKHLLLSRQGTNSRILESVSYIPSVRKTHKHMRTHTAYMQTYRQLVSPLLPLFNCFLACPMNCWTTLKFLC